jgi:hypothetical protein
VQSLHRRFRMAPGRGGALVRGPHTRRDRSHPQARPWRRSNPPRKSQSSQNRSPDPEYVTTRSAGMDAVVFTFTPTGLGTRSRYRYANTLATAVRLETINGGNRRHVPGVQDERQGDVSGRRTAICPVDLQSPSKCPQLPEATASIDCCPARSRSRTAIKPAPK